MSALGRANSGTITLPLAARLSHFGFVRHPSTCRTLLGSTSNDSKGADGGPDRLAPEADIFGFSIVGDKFAVKAGIGRHSEAYRPAEL